MDKNLNEKGLTRAFNRRSSKKVEEKGETIKETETITENANPEKKDNYKIANFAEDFIDRANYNGMDIVFVLDTTASMSPYIEGAKESIRVIIADARESLKEMEQSEDTLKFALVVYRDHPPEDTTYVTQICDFTDAASILEYLSKVTAQGGGDGSEAVLDGLNDAIYKTSWRSDSEKYLFMVLDWPPHGQRFNSSSDNFPNGCPCGYHEKDLLPKMREMKIDFTIIKVADQINTMIDLFSQFINIEVHQPQIFSQKSKYRGSKGAEDYTEGVKKEMSRACGGKVKKNLDIYRDSKKASTKKETD
jgi:hypothetical protein